MGGTDLPWMGAGRTPVTSGRRRGDLPDHAARDWAGGLWAGAGQSPRCVRIFSMTSGYSMQAMSRSPGDPDTPTLASDSPAGA